MPRNVRLPDIEWGDPVVDAAFKMWRQAIEGSHNWEVRGSADLNSSKEGYNLFVKSGKGTMSAVVTAEISAMSGSTLGDGEATIRVRDGDALVDVETGAIVYSEFSVVVTVGTNIRVQPDGDAYMLVTADCA
jgi:hypothetical protein